MAVRVVDLSAWEAALHYAADPLPAFDDETARQTVSVLVEWWDERAVSLPSVAETIERLDGTGELAD